MYVLSKHFHQIMYISKTINCWDESDSSLKTSATSILLLLENSLFSETYVSLDGIQSILPFNKQMSTLLQCICVFKLI